MGASTVKIGFSAMVLLAAATALGQRGTAGYTAQVNAGQRALAAKKFREATEHFQYALRFNEGGVDAHNGLGEVYLRLGKKQRALEQFAEVLRISPHSSEAERGIHEARTEGQEEHAFELLEASAGREEKNADLQTTFAEELIERGGYEEAKVRAQRALGLDPHQWHAYCALGRIAAHDGDVNTAMKDLQIAIAHDYTDDDALETLGNLEMKAHHFEQAARWFRRLTQILPDDAEAHQLLALALEGTGDKSGAAKERATASAINQKVEGSK